MKKRVMSTIFASALIAATLVFSCTGAKQVCAADEEFVEVVEDAEAVEEAEEVLTDTVDFIYGVDGSHVEWRYVSKPKMILFYQYGQTSGAQHDSVMNQLFQGGKAKFDASKIDIVSAEASAQETSVEKLGDIKAYAASRSGVTFCYNKESMVSELATSQHLGDISTLTILYANNGSSYNIATGAVSDIYAFIKDKFGVDVKIPDAYTIKFNGNGATTGSMSDMTCNYDESYSLARNGFSKNGYTFGGWYTNQACTGTAYADGATVKNLTTGGGTVTLYAKWNLITYNINYDMNGVGSEPGNPKSYTVETADITLKKASATGYDFVGWYSDAACTKSITKIACKSTTGDITLYAKWKAHTYTVKFNGNGATSGKVKNQKFTYGKAKALYKNRYKKKGYDFKGWTTKKNGSGVKYSDKQQVSDITAKNGATVNLYAQWGVHEYTIKYVLKGGVNDERNKESYSVKTKTFKLYPPHKKGYNFLGWYKNKNYTGKITKIKKGSTKDYTLYAKWEPIVYKVVYHANTAVEHQGGDDKVQSCKYGKSYEYLDNPFSREGGSFKYWTTHEDGSGEKIYPGDDFESLTCKQDREINLYAQWDEYHFTLNFDMNGGYGNKNNSDNQYHAYNDQFRINRPVGYRSGKYFMRWNTQSDGNGIDVEPGDGWRKITTGNNVTVTLYAKWGDADMGRSYTTLQAVNSLRASSGLGGLVMDDTLCSVAAQKAAGAPESSRDMLAAGGYYVNNCTDIWLNVYNDNITAAVLAQKAAVNSTMYTKVGVGVVNGCYVMILAN